MLPEKSISDEPDSSPSLPNDDDIDDWENCADSTKLSDYSKPNKAVPNFAKLSECPKTEKDCADQPVFSIRCGLL